MILPNHSVSTKEGFEAVRQTLHITVCEKVCKLVVFMKKCAESVYQPRRTRCYKLAGFCRSKNSCLRNRTTRLFERKSKHSNVLLCYVDKKKFESNVFYSIICFHVHCACVFKLLNILSFFLVKSKNKPEND